LKPLLGNIFLITTIFGLEEEPKNAFSEWIRYEAEEAKRMNGNPITFDCDDFSIFSAANLKNHSQFQCIGYC
jgi:hypothetical protein